MKQDNVPDEGMHTHHAHAGFDPARLLAMEEHRRSFMPPEPLLEELLTDPTWSLLDLGCGTGYYTVPAARLLSRGRVYALDVQENMVETTLVRVRRAGLHNVEGIVAPSSRIPLGDASIDAALVAMVYHDLSEKGESLAELRRVLKPAGVLSMVEWDRIDSDFGPPMGLRITPSELEKALESAGFSVVATKRSEAQPALYFLRARPSSG